MRASGLSTRSVICFGVGFGPAGHAYGPSVRCAGPRAPPASCSRSMRRLLPRGRRQALQSVQNKYTSFCFVAHRVTGRAADIRYHHLMAAPGDQKSRAGFVLAGGRSSRMGRDKALLPLDGRHSDRPHRRTRPARRRKCNLDRSRRPLRGLSRDPRPDREPGPARRRLHGLSATKATWNLLVACDMPGLTLEFLEDLFRAAESSRRRSASSRNPPLDSTLCAPFTIAAASLPAISSIERKILKMHDFVATLQVQPCPFPTPPCFETSILPINGPPHDGQRNRR